MHLPGDMALMLAQDTPLWQQMLLPLGLVLITVFVFSRMRARRQRSAQQLTAREQVERLRQHSGVRGDLETLMVEIEQLAKRMGAQLDAKAVHLEKLLREADQRVEQLQRLSGESRPAESASPGEDIPPDPLAAKVCDLADQGLAPVDIARRLDEHIGKVELILALRQ